ncbi:transport protein TonB [Shigella dysenteriae]|uniref:Transport protein TonB n=1 Tax=Shigella dysenteriae TaxID=622 RepID=A0A2X2IAV0_SHIDY|nr:transport protein TonB [Shigella dysenteriae]
MRRWRYEPGKSGSGIVVNILFKITAPPKFSKHKVKSLRPEAFDYYSTGKARGFLQDQPRHT